MWVNGLYDMMVASFLIINTVFLAVLYLKIDDIQTRQKEVIDELGYVDNAHSRNRVVR